MMKREIEDIKTVELQDMKNMISKNKNSPYINTILRRVFKEYVCISKIEN